MSFQIEYCIWCIKLTLCLFVYLCVHMVLIGCWGITSCRQTSTEWGEQIITARQKNCRKVMFSDVSVHHSVWGWSHVTFTRCIGTHCTGVPSPWTLDLMDPRPHPSCKWHLVAITGDLCKLVHFKSPLPISGGCWSAQASGTHPTGMLSCYLSIGELPYLGSNDKLFCVVRTPNLSGKYQINSCRHPNFGAETPINIHYRYCPYFWKVIYGILYTISSQSISLVLKSVRSLLPQGDIWMSALGKPILCNATVKLWKVFL